MSADTPAKPNPKAQRAEQARLARFFVAIDKHRKALDLAIAEDFGGELDPAEWRRAFESAEPHDANRTMVVTGDHSAGSRLIGLLPYRRPHAEQAFEALLADGGVSKDQAALLNEIYVLEGRLEHASPDVDAEEVRDAVERLRKALPSLIDSTRAWLDRHGVELR